MFKEGLKQKAAALLDSAKKDVNETATNIQKTLDESGKSVKMVITGTLIALGVSILCNFITIGMTVHVTKSNKGSQPIVIENLYLGGKPNGK